jgi:hypothetical protein
MAGYLDTYGAGDERREKLIWRSLAAVAAVVVLALVLYFSFRNFREERQLKSLLELLAKKDYAGAYRLWGCTDANPCRDYSLERFLEDWGPSSPYTDVTHARVVKSASCGSGISQTLEFSSGRQVGLWVERKDLSIGFDPWPAWRQTRLARLFNDCSGVRQRVPQL